MKWEGIRTYLYNNFAKRINAKFMLITQTSIE